MQFPYCINITQTKIVRKNLKNMLYLDSFSIFKISVNKFTLYHSRTFHTKFCSKLAYQFQRRRLKFRTALPGELEIAQKHTKWTIPLNVWAGQYPGIQYCKVQSRSDLSFRGPKIILSCKSTAYWPTITHLSSLCWVLNKSSSSSHLYMVFFLFAFQIKHIKLCHCVGSMFENMAPFLSRSVPHQNISGLNTANVLSYKVLMVVTSKTKDDHFKSEHFL